MHCLGLVAVVCWLFFFNFASWNVIRKRSINTGKTTLLKCLIGLSSIDSGDIDIFGSNTKHLNTLFNINIKEIGFMPQVRLCSDFESTSPSRPELHSLAFTKDTCLYPDLTITEIFYYFAKLHNISNDRIKVRQEFLLKLLNLPDSNKLVKFLR
jgi:ABC-type multidrug transport system ATPase subunit